MGSYYAEPPINPSPEPWSFPPPDYFSALIELYKYAEYSNGQQGEVIDYIVNTWMIHSLTLHSYIEG